MILHIKLVKTKQMWVIKPPVVCLRGCKDGGFVSSMCSENSIFLTPVHFTTSLNLSTFSPSSNLSRDIFVWPKITNVFIILVCFWNLRCMPVLGGVAKVRVFGFWFPDVFTPRIQNNMTAQQRKKRDGKGQRIALLFG